MPEAGSVTNQLRHQRADAHALLLRQPRPRGPRTAVVTADDASRSRAASALDDAGLLPASVTQHTEMRTRLVAPAATHRGGSVTCPVTAGTCLGDVLATLAEDPGVDAVLVAVDPVEWPGGQLADTLDGVSARFPRTTVVAVGAFAGRGGCHGVGRVPTFADLPRAAQALAATLDVELRSPWEGCEAPHIPA
jgi:acyl-CoA synthetase (NDP forming)